MLRDFQQVILAPVDSLALALVDRWTRVAYTGANVAAAVLAQQVAVAAQVSVAPPLLRRPTLLLQSHRLVLEHCRR